MEAIEQLKIDLREERIDANRLIDLIFTLQQRIAELEKQVAGSGTAKVDEPYSMKAEEKRQEARGKKKPNSRTNKTAAGARRQTILTSVLQSLRLYLPTFTLTTVLAEIQRWIEQGRSCFEKQLKKLNLHPPEHSVLDRVLPQPRLMIAGRKSAKPLRSFTERESELASDRYPCAQIERLPQRQHQR